MSWKTGFRSLYYQHAPDVVCCGIFTDQCVSSTVRSLADELLGYLP
jgi:nicotinamidase-related amidase